MAHTEVQDAPSDPSQSPLRSVHTTNLPDLLSQLQISLAISTYQAGKVIIARNAMAPWQWPHGLLGWPQAHEDDAQQAVHAGLGMNLQRRRFSLEMVWQRHRLIDGVHSASTTEWCGRTRESLRSSAVILDGHKAIPMRCSPTSECATEGENDVNVFHGICHCGQCYCRHSVIVFAAGRGHGDGRFS